MNSSKIEVIGAEPIIKGMKDRVPERVLNENLRDIVLLVDKTAKESTVVDTGRLRASITHTISGMTGRVGTNVEYAPFIEYGTQRMLGRHMEGATKVVNGVGMFAHALKVLEPELENYETRIVNRIEKESLGK